MSNNNQQTTEERTIDWQDQAELITFKSGRTGFHFVLGIPCGRTVITFEPPEDAINATLREVRAASLDKVCVKECGPGRIATRALLDSESVVMKGESVTVTCERPADGGQIAVVEFIWLDDDSEPVELQKTARVLDQLYVGEQVLEGAFALGHNNDDGIEVDAVVDGLALFLHHLTGSKKKARKVIKRVVKLHKELGADK